MPKLETMAMKNLKSKKLYLQVYDEIKEYIFKNKLRPGDKLPTEMEMSALLGVSRNVLREAIKSLEITGAIKSTPGVGIIVQEFSPDFLFQSMFYCVTGDSLEMLQQTLAVRRVIELGFLQQTFNTLEDIDMPLLQEQVDIMQRNLDKCDATTDSLIKFGREFYEADAKFHKILHSKTGNSILQSIIDAVWTCDKYHRLLINIRYFADTVNKHITIVNALKAHDFEAYKNAMQYHFDVHYKVHQDESIHETLTP